MLVTPPTVLELDGITVRVMLEKLRVATWKMSNKILCKVLFYSVKSQPSDPTKRQFH